MIAIDSHWDFDLGLTFLPTLNILSHVLCMQVLYLNLDIYLCVCVCVCQSCVFDNNIQCPLLLL